MPLVLFFLNPAISLIVAFFMNIKKQTKVFNIFILLFSLYFGYSLTPYNKQFDSYQIIQIFKNWTYLFPTFSDFLSEYIKFENPFEKIFLRVVYSLLYILLQIIIISFSYFVLCFLRYLNYYHSIFFYNIIDII